MLKWCSHKKSIHSNVAEKYNILQLQIYGVHMSNPLSNYRERNT